MRLLLHLLTSLHGTNLPFRNVHYMTAFGGDPDIEPMAPDVGRRKACIVLAPPNWGMGRTGNSLRPFRTIQVRL
jgi:hypothetical protein